MTRNTRIAFVTAAVAAFAAAMAVEYARAAPVQPDARLVTPPR
jgi:hypothetical protein